MYASIYIPVYQYLYTCTYIWISPQALVSDVESHEKDLDSLESAVNDVITLVDEDHQSELSSRLQSVSLRYRCHGFSSHCYPVERSLDKQSLQLCRMAPTGVVVTEIQVGGRGQSSLQLHSMQKHLSHSVM